MVLDLVPRILDVERYRLKQREYRQESGKYLALLVLHTLYSLGLRLIKLAKAALDHERVHREHGTNQAQQVYLLVQSVHSAAEYA